MSQYLFWFLLSLTNTESDTNPNNKSDDETSRLVYLLPLQSDCVRPVTALGLPNWTIKLGASCDSFLLVWAVVEQCNGAANSSPEQEVDPCQQVGNLVPHMLMRSSNSLVVKPFKLSISSSSSKQQCWEQGVDLCEQGEALSLLLVITTHSHWVEDHHMLMSSS